MPPTTFGFEDEPVGELSREVMVGESYDRVFVSAWRCVRCQALVDEDNLQGHFDWHILLSERLRYIASLGGHDIGHVSV